MPYKAFQPEQLTASEVQTYLMNQSIMVFANSAARSAALTAPTEGMVTYLQDVNNVEFYNGSAWQGIQSSSGTFGGSNLAGTTYAQVYVNATNSTTGAGITLLPSGGTVPWSVINTGSAASQGAGSLLLYRNNTDAASASLALNSSGQMTVPNQPRFLVYTSGYNHTGGAWLDISTLGGAANRVVDYNIGSGWSTSTGLFTAPVTGYYLFYAGGWANYNGAGNRYAISFHINANVGGDWVYISGANTSAVDSPLAMSPVVRYMTAGQYMRTAMFSSVAMQLGTSSHKFYYGGYLLG